MSEKVALKNLRCPTCGAPLKAKNQTDSITCVYCGNSIVPVMETPTEPKQTVAGFGGTVRVEGIKTSSSALAYIDLFFEEYDWEAFAFAQSLSVAEIDRLVNSLKVSSADDKNTWLACFKAAAVPMANKIVGCQTILGSVIEEYKKDDLESYSKFDAYKRIAAMISTGKDDLVAKLQKIVSKAAKYGASAEEVNGLNADIERIKKLAKVEVYQDVESIPEIKAFIREKNAKILSELAAKGIKAEEEYAKAKDHMEKKRYAEALNILLSLNGYADSKALIEKLDQYYLLDDVLEIEGNLYYFKQDDMSKKLSLYPTEGGKICSTPIIENIGNIISNHADILYYLNGKNQLKQYNLSTKTATKLSEKTFKKKAIYVYGRKVFLLSKPNNEDSDQQCEVVELDLTTGAVRTVVENVKKVISLLDNKLVYIGVQKIRKDGEEGAAKTVQRVNVVDVDTMNIVEIGTKDITVEGVVKDYLVFTRKSPNDYNKDLYIKALNGSEPEKLVEKNIYHFCAILADKLFYYVGNSRSQSLINMNCDGTERKEWPLYISDVLFEQGGWLYFIRKAGYNSILCKSRLDGSRFSIIAADIDRFIQIKNGYLYYINNDAALVKVRMDGSNLQTLCGNVEKVLSVREDKIVFVSLDDKIATENVEESRPKTVKSIYAVDFSGSGKIKLAYNIVSAKEYDENTVYYVAKSTKKSSGDQTAGGVKELYKLNVETYCVEKLLPLQVEEEEKEMSPFTVAMIIMCIALFFAVVGFASGMTGMGIIGLLAAILTLGVGLAKKYGNDF